MLSDVYLIIIVQNLSSSILLNAVKGKNSFLDIWLFQYMYKK